MSPSDRLLFLISSFALFIQISCEAPCAPTVCNNFTFLCPFQTLNYGYPGTVLVNCDQRPTIRSWCDTTYRVLGNTTESANFFGRTTSTLRIADDALFGDGVFDSRSTSCPEGKSNPEYITNRGQVLLDSVLFDISYEYSFGTILSCRSAEEYKQSYQPVQCLDNGKANNSCFFARYLYNITDDKMCSAYPIVIPTEKSFSAQEDVLDFLRKGFEITWTISDGRLQSFHFTTICYRDLYIRNPRYWLWLMFFIVRWAIMALILAAVVIIVFGAYIPARRRRKRNRDEEEPWLLLIAIIVLILAAAVICISIFLPSFLGFLLFALALAIAVLILAAVVKFIFRLRKRKRDEEEQEIRRYMDPLDSTSPSVENYLHGYSSGMPTRYSYAKIKRYTNNFADILGHGGFGTVFKGKLPGGCLVAIKILDKTKHSRKQFMNEVATVGTIHHIHLVRLLGYCFQGSKRALIYEYMVNGSLEKYVHAESGPAHPLDWKQLYCIAIGTARGILYLHEECRSRILHCDIKPHNVLLDANFSPKVSDFGLAKLADREGSHVSLTGARGTPGYVAPEVWSRNHGPVTDKSDVYSYGMLLMEMVGGRKNIDIHASRPSQFYYPEWVFKQIEKGEFARVVEGNIIAEEEDESTATRLSLVGLWCIQYNASSRPSMRQVIQMLEGSVETSIPPYPFPVDTPVQPSSSTESSSTVTLS